MGSHYTIGLILIPREFLFSIKYEANCLEKVFKALVEDFEEMKIKKFTPADVQNLLAQPA